MSERARFILHMKIDYDVDGANLRQLQAAIHKAALDMPAVALVGDQPARIVMRTVGVALDKRPEDERKEGAQAVAVIGNLCDGFRFVGPYPDFDAAAEAWDGCDSWIATLHEPTLPPTSESEPTEVQQFIDRLKLAEKLENHEAVLDDLVHDAASQIGSSVNNGGTDEQIRFLIEQFGAADAGEAILAAVRAAKEEEE